MLMDALRHAVGQLGGRRALPGTEAKDMHFREARLFDGAAGGGEIVLRFAGKTDDDIGRQGGPIEPRANLFAAFEKSPDGQAALHLFQNRIGAALQGQMQMRADPIGTVGHQLAATRA